MDIPHMVCQALGEATTHNEDVEKVLEGSLQSHFEGHLTMPRSAIGRYALRLEVKNRESCWLLAEKSGAIRAFKRAETALEMCRRLGLELITVHLQSLGMLPRVRK